MADMTSQDMAGKLLAAGFERSGPAATALSDPIADTPMVVTLDQLRPYDHDPRMKRNPAYEEIKASIRERGLDAGVGAVAGSFCDGRYNVTLDGRKLAGTAQRWRRNGAGRPVVLAHAALLVGAEREEMVEVVTTFTRRCASAPDCQADSHLGLSERWSDFRMADSLELERRFVAARS